MNLIFKNYYEPGWLSQKIGNITYENPFLEKIIKAKLLDDMLPILEERVAFKNVSEQAITEYLKVFDEFPEILSRYGRIIRHNLDMEPICPTNYIIIEAHIDISSTNKELKNSIIGCGFEPDSFFSLNPPEYFDCFTCRMEIPKSYKYRRKVIKKHLIEKMKIIQSLVESQEGIIAYSEIEAYNNNYKKRYNYHPPTLDAINEFPFKINEFEPTSDISRKYADLHIKIPFTDESHKFFNLLKTRFLASGFYEISSNSGNFIYTIQYESATDGRNAFRKIKKWADKFNCIKGIELEICFHFWRKKVHFENEFYNSPIPKIQSRMQIK